jgi:HD-GYP domain-containing protein (c-di-GMP phosphodiesterase class II)
MLCESLDRPISSDGDARAEAGTGRREENLAWPMLAEISDAIEERDRTTGHGRRVAQLAEGVAAGLGWTDEQMATLRFAAPLHDIGKVAVRLDVLRKPGPLTVEEAEEIRRHPVAGAALIEPIRSARCALPYVLYHHERWDGRGYPEGLVAEEIPIEARLLAVADAFDAMTSARPYRRPLGVHAALEEIGRCGGTQFDPEIAELFLEIWARALARAS